LFDQSPTESNVDSIPFSFIYEKYPASILPPLVRTVALDPNSKAEREKLIADLQMIMDIFTINSYCLSIDMSEIVNTSNKNGNTNLNNTDFEPITVKMIVRAPSNLWSDQALRKRNENPINDFEIKVIKAICRRWGLQVDVMSTNILNKIDVVHVFKISKKL
jgi:hypothetical protein